jgi:hypothetical protein
VSTGTPVIEEVAASVIATGDPHVTNVYGQKFEIYQYGSTLRFLQVPRVIEGNQQPKITVDARVDRLSSFPGCKHSWIRNLRLAGTLLDNTYEFGVNSTANSFFLRVGEQTTSLEEFVKLAPKANVVLEPAPTNSWYKMTTRQKDFPIIARIRVFPGDATLSVELVYNRRTLKHKEHESHLNFDATNLERLAADKHEIGGLLGIDPHHEVSDPAKCQQEHPIGRSLMESEFEEDEVSGSFASASSPAFA